jgi:hypothetical protein
MLTGINHSTVDARIRLLIAPATDKKHSPGRALPRLESRQ